MSDAMATTYIEDNRESEETMRTRFTIEERQPSPNHGTVWAVIDDHRDGYGLFPTEDQADRMARALAGEDVDTSDCVYVDATGTPVPELNERE